MVNIEQSWAGLAKNKIPMNTMALRNFIEQVLAVAQAGLTFSKDEFDIAHLPALFHPAQRTSRQLRVFCTPDLWGKSSGSHTPMKHQTFCRRRHRVLSPACRKKLAG